MLKQTFYASASEIKRSKIFITVKTIMLTSPSPNKNGVRCTEAFIDDIVNSQNEYMCLPLSADVTNLEQRHYDNLGHMYNETQDKYYSTMIGSFYKFDKEVNGPETMLIGYARILKRNREVCNSVIELFDKGKLSFSFEITAGTYQTLEDGTLLIDRAEDNYLEGLAIVSNPACEEAVALELVAQNVSGKEEAEMNEKEIEVAVNSNAEIEQAIKEALTQQPALNNVEEVTIEAFCKPKAEGMNPECNPEQECKPEEKPCEQDAGCRKNCEEEDAACKKCGEEDASCKKCSEEEDAACKKCGEEENAGCRKNCEEENAGCRKNCEENMDAACKKCGEDVDAEEENGACKRNCAEEMIAQLQASLNTIVEKLNAQEIEIKQLKEANDKKQFVASVANPFMDSISVDNAPEYDLLKEDSEASYDLLNAW